MNNMYIPTFIPWLLLILPPSAALISILLKYFNKKKDQEKKKEYYLEFTILAITIMLLGIQQQNILTTHKMNDINNILIEEEGYKSYNNNTSVDNLNNIISDQINREMNIDKSSKILIKVLFNTPGSPDYKNDKFWQEFVTLNSFKSGIYKLKFFIGYDEQEATKNNKNADIKRRKMQLFAFKILTNPQFFSDDIKNTLSNLALFYYLPISKDYDIWAIRSTNGHFAGMVHNDDNWSGDGIYPNYTSIVQIENQFTARSLYNDHLIYEEWSKRKLSEEYEREGYYREPIMVFTCPHGNKLIPKTLEEVEDQYNKWMKSFYMDFGKDVKAPKTVHQ